ncbi:MAG: signal peptidase II, partial [Oscillospiraceae bacterium]|nr:signal peptidase II [Oscillospiraceae bacterium]
FAIVSGKVRRPILVASFSLIIGGGIGNLIDRIFRGFVVDYFEVRLFDFAVFNFADCCVIIGAVMFLLVYIFFDKSKKEQRAREEKTDE